jgi:hypothetical protein
MLEAGADLRTIQVLLEHFNFERSTVRLYLSRRPNKRFPVRSKRSKCRVQMRLNAPGDG